MDKQHYRTASHGKPSNNDRQHAKRSSRISQDPGAEDAGLYHKPLPLNLESSLNNLSRLDGALKNKFDRIQLKNL